MAAQVLVTGATGFVGRYLVRLLQRENLPVRVLVRSESKAFRLFGDSVEVVEGDLDSGEAVDLAFRGIETAYHVGGAYLFGSANRQELMRTNLGGTRNVLAAAWRNRAERVIHVSTASLLLNHRGMGTESHFPSTPFRFGHYKRSKWLAEQCAMVWQKRGLPVVIVNPSSPIGPEDEKPTPTGRMILDFMNGRFPFVSKTGLNFISVNSCAEGILAAGRRGIPGRRYLLTDANLWLSEFLELLSRHTPRPVPRFTIPWPAILAAGLAGEIAGHFSPKWGQRVCLETAYYASKVQFFDGSQTRAELGWAPAESVDSAARRAIDWYYVNAPSIGLPAARPLPVHDVIAR